LDLNVSLLLVDRSKLPKKMIHSLQIATVYSNMEWKSNETLLVQGHTNLSRTCYSAKIYERTFLVWFDSSVYS
jgi:hypothetical protein